MKQKIALLILLCGMSTSCAENMPHKPEIPEPNPISMYSYKEAESGLKNVDAAWKTFKAEFEAWLLTIPEGVLQTWQKNKKMMRDLLKKADEQISILSNYVLTVANPLSMQYVERAALKENAKSSNNRLLYIIRTLKNSKTLLSHAKTIEAWETLAEGIGKVSAIVWKAFTDGIALIEDAPFSSQPTAPLYVPSVALLPHAPSTLPASREDIDALRKAWESYCATAQRLIENPLSISEESQNIPANEKQQLQKFLTTACSRGKKFFSLLETLYNPAKEVKNKHKVAESAEKDQADLEATYNELMSLENSSPTTATLKELLSEAYVYQHRLSQTVVPLLMRT